jgi:hypothetical protein
VQVSTKTIPNQRKRVFVKWCGNGWWFWCDGWGGELMHYVGDPMTDNIMPNEIDHAPFLP